MSLATDTITIKRVLELSSGDELDAETVINQKNTKEESLRGILGEIFALNKNRWRDGLELLRTPYCCPDCGGNLRLNSYGANKFYFIHAYKNISCPSLEGGRLTDEQVFARQYNGKKEGDEHKNIKHLLCETLRCADNFENIHEERFAWNEGRTRWRKPDIALICSPGSAIPKYAFEIQISYTFVTIIYERKIFYSESNIPLLWVFKDVDFSSLNITRDDAFYANNCNIFTVNENTALLSKKYGQPILECHYMVPKIKDGKITYNIENKLLSLFDMQYDAQSGVIYYFDFKYELKKKYIELLRVKIDKRYHEFGYEYEELDDYFSRVGINFERLCKEDRIQLVVSVQNIFSAFAGKCVGSKFGNIVELFNYINGKHRYSFFPFACAINFKGDKDSLLSRIKSPELKKDVNKMYAEALKKNPELCPPAHVVNEIVKIFPELTEKLTWFHGNPSEESQ